MRSKVSEAASKKSGDPLSKSEAGILASRINNARKQMDRKAMIATAAYYRAEKRGFQSSEADVLQDWLEAEIEVNNQLDSPN